MKENFRKPDPFRRSHIFLTSTAPPLIYTKHIVLNFCNYSIFPERTNEQAVLYHKGIKMYNLFLIFSYKNKTDDFTTEHNMWNFNMHSRFILYWADIKLEIFYKTLIINPQTPWNTRIFARERIEFTTNLLLLRKKSWCAVKTLADKSILPQIRKVYCRDQN